jgi:glutaconate CoA-transferase subunit A
MTTKLSSLEEVVSELRPGMTIGLGGWGSRRKPMSVVREIARQRITGLTIVSYAGPDVGLLIAAGCVSKLVYGFVTLDSIPLDPWFRAARQAGCIEATELDEGMLYLGLLAASWRVPFLPTRAGLGSGVMEVNPWLRTVASPYAKPGEEAEELVAMPAIELDAAFVHVNAADTHGNGQVLGPDPYFDELFLGASRRLRVVTAERVVAPGDLLASAPIQSVVVNRMLTDAVVESPLGAHFTSCPPDYGRDEEAQRLYAGAAADEGSWDELRKLWLEDGERAYVEYARRKAGSTEKGA